MKLNKKGFTLVELLAVIIILAIVVGVTIPAILSTINSAKEKAFQTAAETSADWIERQYQLFMVNPSDSGLNATLASMFNNGETTITTGALIEATGVKTVDVSNIEFRINAGRVCVILTATNDGSYKGTGTVDANGGASSGTNYAKGGACSGVTFG